MEIIFVDRKFSIAHARMKVAIQLSVDSGENSKIALALNERRRCLAMNDINNAGTGYSPTAPASILAVYLQARI